MGRGKSIPAVSVVAATCDRPKRLSRLLAALAAQDFSESWEVVVVDDSTDDATPKVLAEWVAGGGGRAVVKTSGRTGPGAARNRGWRKARGGLIAFTDDDCEPSAGWLRALVSASEVGANAVLQGPTSPNPAELSAVGPFSRTLEVRSLGPWFPTCNMAYPRSLLESLEGFDEAFLRGEDTDLAWRAIAAGAPVQWVADAHVHHGVIELGPVGALRLALAWRPAFALYGRHPRLRKALHLGLFWKPAHLTLLLAILGLALIRRTPVALALAAPHAYSLRVRMHAENASLKHVPFYVAQDALETVAAAHGSLESGTLVL